MVSCLSYVSQACFMSLTPPSALSALLSSVVSLSLRTPTCRWVRCTMCRWTDSPSKACFLVVMVLLLVLWTRDRSECTDGVSCLSLYRELREQVDRKRESSVRQASTWMLCAWGSLTGLDREGVQTHWVWECEGSYSVKQKWVRCPYSFLRGSICKKRQKAHTVI